MAIAITHAFISLKGDGTDATQVQPSNWNAAHATSMASGNVLGRLSAGAGAFEEIPISAYMAGLLATPDAATLIGLLGGHSTGDVKYTFASPAPTGWILINNGDPATIGNAGAAGTIRNSADTFNLYNLIYNNVTNLWAPVSGGRSGNALTDFNALKTIAIPNLSGRSPLGVSNTALAWMGAVGLGVVIGEPTHTLTPAEIPGISSNGGGVSCTVGPSGGSQFIAIANGTPGHFAPGVGGGGSFDLPDATGGWSYPTTLSGSTAGINVASNNTSGQPHNNIHPVVGLNAMVKL